MKPPKFGLGRVLLCRRNSTIFTGSFLYKSFLAYFLQFSPYSYSSPRGITEIWGKPESQETRGDRKAQVPLPSLLRIIGNSLSATWNPLNFFYPVCPKKPGKHSENQPNLQKVSMLKISNVVPFSPIFFPCIFLFSSYTLTYDKNTPNCFKIKRKKHLTAYTRVSLVHGVPICRVFI